MPQPSATNRAVTLDEVLANKEARVQRQHEMMGAHPGGIISFTINIPGPVKDADYARTAFDAGINAIAMTAIWGGWVIKFRSLHFLPTGPEALLSTNLDPQSLKKAMIRLEEEHPLGRLFDLDVLDEEGKPLSRAAFGGPLRACLICDKPAQECVRYRTHTQEDLAEAISAMVEDYDGDYESLSREEDSFAPLRKLPANATTQEKILALKAAVGAARGARETAPRRRRSCCLGCLGRLLILFGLVYAALAGGIAYWGKHQQNAMYTDVLVVLGNEAKQDGTPSPRLAARLDKTLELYKLKRSTIIVSGGVGESGLSEATVMAEYLQGRGVAQNDLVLDHDGVNTWATAKFTREYLRTRKQVRVVAVSQYFHLFRCKLALRLAGVSEVGVAAPDYYELRDIYSTAREVAAVIGYIKNHGTVEKLVDIVLF